MKPGAGPRLNSRGLPRLTKDAPEARQIVDLREAGFTHQEIEEFTGYPRTTISTLLRREGVGGGRIVRQRLPNAAFDIVRLLYMERGWTAKEIGAKLGIKETSVLWRLNRAGVERRTRKEANLIHHAKRRAEGRRHMPHLRRERDENGRFKAGRMEDDEDVAA